MEDKKYPIGGFAPGNYTCKCVSCKENFVGDKRAVQCENCAVKENKKQIKDLYNAINSQYKDATKEKFGRKNYKTEKILKLEAQLEILNRLIR